MNSTKTLTVQYQNTVQDYLRADNAMHARMPMKTNQMSAIFLLGFGIYTIYTHDVGVMTYVCLVMGVVQMFRLIQKAVILIMARTNARALQPADATFDDKGFLLVTPIQRTLAPWSIFEEAIETPDAFIFTLGRGRYTLVPKRAFKEKHLNELRKLLRKHKLMPEGN